MSRQLRNRKKFHAVVRGKEAKSKGVYLDFSKCKEATAGMSTSIYESFESLQDAVNFMKTNGIESPNIISYKADKKYIQSMEEYLEKGAEVDECVSNDLLTDTISFPRGDDEIDSLLEDTIKECEKSVLSWISAPNDVLTQS